MGLGGGEGQKNWEFSLLYIITEKLHTTQTHTKEKILSSLRRIFQAHFVVSTSLPLHLHNIVVKIGSAPEFKSLCLHYLILQSQTASMVFGSTKTSLTGENLLANV